MITWFEDLEVTRFLNLTFPPSLEAEKEWLAKTGTDPNVIWWIIEHEGRAVGALGSSASTGSTASRKPAR